MTNPALDSEHPVHHSHQSFGEVFDEYKQLVIGELGSDKFGVYVSCFCESGDLLSQWRAYGSDHGYAIEIEADALPDAAQRLPMLGAAADLVQVRYGERAAADVVEGALRKVWGDTNLGHYGVHAHFMALQLTAMLATIKHPGFQEEREWRLVAALEGEEERVQFRATPMAIVPYVEVPLPRDAIRSIRVGPGRHVDVRANGVRRLLASIGSDADVLVSTVPLRT
jgi:hypothetical protein